MSQTVVNACSDELDAKLRACEDRIDYAFADRRLLVAALTHASGAEHRLASNERLEFLGDAILGVVACEMLFHRFPQYLEGDLTRIKSMVVSRQSCTRISERLGLHDFLILGKGVGSAGRIPDSLLSDVFESMIAAVYLDGGLDAARSFAARELVPEIDAAVSGQAGDNYKSLLQQVAQREFGEAPVYELVGEKGPDHRKTFRVAALVGNRRYPSAWGRNKKEAEQRAAYNALSELIDWESAP
ncbi:MAG: ribonuclease III [Planctomycetes bacterium]|nr:ribonuclease III [Planctomycetota bacterium]